MTHSTTDVADVIVLIQELEIDDATRSRLIESVTARGLTEPVKREIQAILVQHIDRDYRGMTAYQQVEDLLTERDAKLATIEKETEQALNRVAMKTEAKLASVGRKIDEDLAAAKAGATLLLHTDDVAPGVNQLSEPPTPPSLTPKQAASVVVQAQRPSQPVSPVSAPPTPVSPSLPSLPSNQPLPATMAPLPPTPIAPPAVTQPSA